MSERQYVAVKFREGDRRSYTYHSDDIRYAVGDVAKAPDKSGDGWQRVHVAAVDVEKPTAFATKALLGKVEPEKPAQGDLIAEQPEAFRNDLGNVAFDRADRLFK